MDGLSVLQQSLDLARSEGAVWVFAGDMKQPKNNWPQSALTGAHAILREYDNVQKILVCGNHDAWGEGGTGLAPFRDCATIVEEPQIVWAMGYQLVCCPWDGDPSVAARLLKEAPSGRRVLIAHAFLQGCMLGPEDARIAKGVPISAYGDFDVAVFGDVHKAQWRRPGCSDTGRPAEWAEMPDAVESVPKGSVFYCGSPMALNWGERNDRAKGVLIVELEDLT